MHYVPHDAHSAQRGKNVKEKTVPVLWYVV